MKSYFLRLTSAILSFTLFFSSFIFGLSGVKPSSKPKIETIAPKKNIASAVSNAQEAVAVLNQNDKTGMKANKDDGVLTECGGNCEHCPTIVIPGIGQSQVFLLDENGNRKINTDGNPATAWPIQVDSNTLIKDLVFPVVKMLITQEDNGFTDYASKAIANAFAANATDLQGHPVNNVEVVKYPRSVEMCSKEDKDFIYGCIPINGFSEVAGEDHLYFLGYNSFGNNLEIAKELYDLIQLVKQETGHTKVNIAPISLGGTITNSLLEFYPQVYNDLNKIVFIVPGLEGSALVGDIYKGTLSTQDDMLYKDLLPSLVDGYAGYLINVALRLIPKQILLDLLSKTVSEIQQSLLFNCTVLWGLVPNSDYEVLAEKNISDTAHSEIKRQTDLFYIAQKNSKANIMKCIEHGVKVFDIVDYNYPIFSFVPSSKTLNGDGLLHAASTSMGATFGYIDTPLPDGYLQQDTYCSDPGRHNHISPDGIVDASTGLLPENTFYFYKQDHERTAGNDIIIKLANQLLLNDDIADVRSEPERFPQFNIGRDAHTITEDLMPIALKIDIGALSSEDADELQAAVDECNEMLNKTVFVYDDFIGAQTRLENILTKIGVYEPYAEPAGSQFAEVICKLLSDALYTYWGPRGFSDRQR